MPTDMQILTLAQWFSPSYPLGSFSYSHGLEWAVEARDVRDSTTLEDWIRTVLTSGAGRSDAIFLAASFQAKDVRRVQELDVLCRAFSASVERFRETDKQGAAFCDTTSHVWGADLPRLAFPVAVGRAAKLCDLPQEMTGSYYLHAFASNLVAAGQRLMRLGQSEAQVLVHGFAPLCVQIAEETRDGDLDHLSNSAYLTDIASMKHETQSSRMFQT